MSTLYMLFAGLGAGLSVYFGMTGQIAPSVLGAFATAFEALASVREMLRESRS